MLNVQSIEEIHSVAPARAWQACAPSEAGGGPNRCGINRRDRAPINFVQLSLFTK
jgi:hypothetical protein